MTLEIAFGGWSSGAHSATLTGGFPPDRDARAPSVSLRPITSEAPAFPSELLFEGYAKAQPELLLRLIGSGAMDSADTALALEVAARLMPPHQTVNLSISLLAHRSPIVREAAVLALAPHVERFAAVRAAVEKRTSPNREPSRAVREAAAAAIQYRAE